jgi:hypothetical protein
MRHFLVMAGEIHRRCIQYADGSHLNKLAYLTTLHSLVFPHGQPKPCRREHYEPIIHARPCRTLHSTKPSGHGPDDPQPREVRRHAGRTGSRIYAQRASVGLIVTEGTQPSDDGQGYLTTPGIYIPAHIAGWKKVTAAVHDKGGDIFIQIMHAGRMSHPDNMPHHRQAVAPSAIAPGTQMFTAAGMQDIPAQRALTTEEVRRTVTDFRLAARYAIEAGADGIEIHGATGYLVRQFFAPSAKHAH